MSRVLLLCLLSLATAQVAVAGDFIIWMESQKPDERVLKRAQRLAGVKDHLFYRDLAFPPQPESNEDTDRYGLLKTAKDDGLQSWKEYDIELELARTLASALDQIDVIRDERDLEALVSSLLFQGAAIYRSFDPETFATDAEAATLRFQQSGFAANLGWSRAMGLDATRRLSRGDVIDASTFMSLRELESAYKALPKGSLDLSHLTHPETLVLDGREITVKPGDSLDLYPGRHYVHVIRDGVISGRQVLEVKSGDVVALPFYVDATELKLAHSQVINGLTTGFPDTVKSAIEAISRNRKGAIFVAAMDSDGQPVVLPYARGAKLAQNRNGAFILYGGTGFGLSKSAILDNEALSDSSWVPTAVFQMGLEVSYSYFCITAGMDLSHPVQRRVTFGMPGSEDAGDDKESFLLPQPWFGVGSYILRPFDNSHTLLVAATTEYLFPAHMGFGGRLVWGLPFKSGKAWFRVTTAASHAPNTLPKWREFEPYKGVSYTKLYLGLSGGGRF